MTVHHPPAFCPRHGLFPAKGFAMSNSIGITFEGNLTDCSKCGAISKVVDGVYSAYADKLQIILSENIPNHIKLALLDLVQKVSIGEISSEEAQAIAEEIHPNSGRFFDFSNWTDTAKATLFSGVLIAAATLINGITASDNQQPSVPMVNVNVHYDPPDFMEKLQNTTASNSLLQRSRPSRSAPIPRPRPKK